MTSIGLRVEYRLNGTSNFLSWEERVTLVLKEYDLWELVDKVSVSLIDKVALEAHEKKEIKVEKVNLDSMKDHLIPNLSKKKMTKIMSMPMLVDRLNRCKT